MLPCSSLGRHERRRQRGVSCFGLGSYFGRRIGMITHTSRQLPSRSLTHKHRKKNAYILMSVFVQADKTCPPKQKKDTQPRYHDHTSEDLAAAASSALRTPSSRAAVNSALCAARRSRRSRARSKRSADTSDSSCERAAPSLARAVRVSANVDEVDSTSALSCVGRRVEGAKYVQATHMPGAGPHSEQGVDMNERRNQHRLRGKTPQGSRP